MRIALVHSYYSSRQPSGENVAVDSQAALLREAGHEVTVVARHTDEQEQSRLYPVRSGLSVASGRGPSPVRELRGFRPDVVHVHNLFPNWGTRWLGEWSGPVVATLHNFRPLCAAGTLFRDGAVCTLCPDGNPKAALTYGCYHGSVAQTVPLAWRNRHGADGDAVLQRADALIVLAERARDLYARYGTPPQKLSLLPNFVLADEPSGATVPDDRWLFVGRLFPEKGVLELLHAWPAGQRLDVVGDGVLSDDVQRALPPGSRLLGSMDHDDVRRLFPHYQGLVLPSRWPESATPLVVLEALAAGVPVVALAGNAAADLVAETGCGAVVGSDAAWGDALVEVRAGRDAFASAARATYEQRFRPQAWLTGITAVYETACAIAR